MDEISHRVLLLLKLDAQNLYERIKTRANDIIHIFDQSRGRGHLQNVFHHRYRDTDITELKQCPVEVIYALDDFYKEADKLHWYLMYTEDMPVAIQDHMARIVHILRDKCLALELLVNQIIGEKSEEQIEVVATSSETAVFVEDDLWSDEVE